MTLWESEESSLLLGLDWNTNVSGPAVPVAERLCEGVGSAHVPEKAGLGGDFGVIEKEDSRLGDRDSLPR